MALSDYTIAILKAVQNGTAYIVPDFIDKNGVVGSGKLHFPGEENYTLPKTRYNVANINASEGIAVNRTSSTGRGNNVTFDPNSSFVLPPLYGGTDGTLADIYVNTGADNKVLPSDNLNNLINIHSSGGPSAFSQMLGAAVMSYLLPGAGSALASTLGITAAEGTALASLGAQLAQGKDIQSALKSAALATAGGTAGSGVNTAVDKALSGLGAVGDAVGNVAGTTVAGLVASGGKADPMALLQAGALGEAVSNVATEIPGYDQLSDAGKRSVNNAIAAELQGRNPTPALLNLAKAAGQSAMANATNVPTEEQVAQQQADFQKQFAQYEEAAPTPSTPNYSVQEMQITPENLASYQQTLSDNFQGSQWTPGGGGDYTLTGDDGSTITMHKDGTTSATEAPPENLLDAIGTTGGQPTQAASGTQPTQAPTAAQPTQTTAAPTPEAAPKGLSVDQLASLYSLFEGETPAAAPQAAEQGAASAQAYAPAKEASFLGELGEKPHYLEGLDPETMALLNQLGIDPAELMAQQEAEGGAESADEHGEEGADYLEAPGGAGGFRTREGVKRGLPAGTLGIAGSDVAKAYQAARADQGFDTSRAFKLPIDDYSRAYMQQLAKAGEAALGEQWAPYIGGRKLAASGQPSADMTQSGNTLAYVPSASIGQYKGFTGALAPELVAMVGKDPGLLNDPDYLAAVLGHELSHQPQQNAGQFMRDLGIHPGKVGAESMAMSKDIASAIPYLAEKYGYKGFYDTKENAPLNERLADIGGWQMQNQVNLTQDPIFKEQVLKTPERMAVYNAMMPQRGVQLDPSFPPVGQLTLEDFGGMAPPLKWAYQNLTPEQFRQQLQIRKRLAGIFGQ